MALPWIIKCYETNIQLYLGTTNKSSAYRAIVLHLLCVSGILIHIFVQDKRDQCLRSSLDSNVKEIETTTKDKLLCSSPYLRNCSCSLVLSRTVSSSDCNFKFYGSFCNPVLLIWILLVFLLTRELITLVGHSSRLIVFTLYIFLFFIYIFLGLFLYQDDCVHRFIVISLNITFLPIGLLALHDMLHISRHYLDSSSSTRPDTSYRISLERHDNQAIAWHEIL